MSKWYIVVSLVVGIILGLMLTIKSLFVFSALVAIVGTIFCMAQDKSGGFSISSRAVTIYYFAMYVLFPFVFSSWLIALAIYIKAIPAISFFHSTTHSVLR